ncbi:MAG: glycosyltransferase family 39 protein [Candidatus Zixiibacteriota bacterium]|nr:MAG: glycosyltransferase family 39 protein [candidate division Zixibacteria bacterium]
MGKKRKKRTDSPVPELPTPVENTFGYRPLLFLAVIFVVSRIVYFALGVRFDMEPLGSFWQYIDPALLKSSLLQSVYYQHSQPPLFNLFLGIVVKLFPGHEAVVFQVVFAVLGLVLNLSLYALLTRLNVSNRLALILTVVFMVSPASILYENFLFYTYPITALLCVSAVMLHRYLQEHRVSDLILFFTMLLMLALTRSFFHILWLVVLWGALLYFRRADRKRVFLTGGVIILLCFSVYAKNAYVFGGFSTSSWFGMNIARMTTWRMGLEERYRLMRLRKLSPLAVIKPFRKLETYQELAQFPLAPPTGIEVLDQPMKSTGVPNLNNFNYIRLSRQYASDAWYVLKKSPGLYLASLAESLHTYWLPSSSYSFLTENRSRIHYPDRAYNLILFGQFDYEDTITDQRAFFSTGLFILAGYLAVLVVGFRLIRRSLSRRKVDYPAVLTLAFLWFNLLYITLVGNAFELGENNRFRFITEPVFVVLLGMAIKNKFRSVYTDQS